MLLQFSVGNFLSFNEEVTFDMRTITSQNQFWDTHTFSTASKIRLSKICAVYGANASGKSNLFEAIRFMSLFVLNSSKNTNAKEPIPVEQFKLFEGNLKKPSFFEIVFEKNKTVYRYGFELNEKEVINEWLYKVNKKSEREVFTRNKGKITFSKTFEKEGKYLEEKTRSNALFLSVVAQFNGKIANMLIEWFDNLIIILNSNNLRTVEDRLKSIYSNEKMKKMFLDVVKSADFGITDILLKESTFDEKDLENLFIRPINLNEESIEEESVAIKNTLAEIQQKISDIKESTRTFVGLVKEQYKEKYTKTTIDYDIAIHKNIYNSNKVHTGKTTEFTFSEESQGTKKYIAILAIIIRSIFENRIIIIDELDSSLHPLLSRIIIELFTSKKDSTAQLIFNTHDITLLSNKYFRRDQIWFAEKDRYGATDLYSLSDYNVRHDASFGKDYLMGKYGAIPCLNSFDFLEHNGEEHGK